MRLIVGITGASGAIYGIRLLEILKDIGVETHLVISKAGHIAIVQETGWKVSAVVSLATKHYSAEDITAAIASGSYKHDGMIVAPCSVNSFSQIASGVTWNLLTRAADVCLKEKRKLLLMVRETPLHEGHLESLMKLSRLGALVFPPVPAFYLRPQTLEHMIEDTLTKALDHFGIETPFARRWA